ncbi:hypothetical protein, partial [Roseinatronobacter sp.]|uniref:hypothetical protein n=1 Tax=Roseinatronobacter sp. TaxID=1945755 RepID=UPI003F71A298
MHLQGSERISSRYHVPLSVAALIGVLALPGVAQAQLLSIGGGSGGGLNVGVSLGGTSANVSVGGGSVAGAEANVGDSVSAGVEVGGGSVASVDASV